MKTAIYARVSSERQDIDLSIAAQLKALRNYALSHGHEVVKEYIDEAESGRSIDRPGFREMIATVHQKSSLFQAILVWKLSRFARNREDSIVYKSLLRRHGVQLISINEPIEDTPAGRLLEGVIEVIDEFYSANLAQDVFRGQRENAERGFSNGGKPPYGYVHVKVKDGPKLRTKLEIDPKTAPIVQRIFRECLYGKGLKAIMRSLNADGLTSRTGKQWGTTSIEKILHNEAYTGTLVWGRRTKNHGQAENDVLLQRTEDAWPAIIDRATFTQAQAKLSGRAPQAIHPRQVDSAYMLSGIIRCGICGAAMIGQGSSSRYRYYMCGNARRKGREVCPSPILPGNKIEGVVVDHIKDYILTEENLEELVRLTNEELAQTNSEDRESLGIIEGQIADVESRLGKLYDALETGKFKSGELAPRIRTLTQKKEELQQAKANIEERLRYEVMDTGGLHAAEHAAIGILPLFALCDCNDIGGVSTPLHPDTGRAQIFIYDAYPGGIGIAEKGFSMIKELWEATLNVVVECPCQEGCPSCVQSPKCGNNNKPLDKEAAKVILGGLVGK